MVSKKFLLLLIIGVIVLLFFILFGYVFITKSTKTREEITSMWFRCLVAIFFDDCPKFERAGCVLEYKQNKGCKWCEWESGGAITGTCVNVCKECEYEDCKCYVD